MSFGKLSSKAGCIFTGKDPGKTTVTEAKVMKWGPGGGLSFEVHEIPEDRLSDN